MKTPLSEKAGPSTDSPKTPGGIRKSLLTPCRRVGLSRKWRGSGVSPFISPLSQCNTPTDNECEENLNKDSKNLDTTPSRPVRKKSIRKTLSSVSKTLDISEFTEGSNETSLDTDIKDTETYEDTPNNTINTVDIEETSQKTNELKKEIKVQNISKKPSKKYLKKQFNTSLTSDLNNIETQNTIDDSLQNMNPKEELQKIHSKKSLKKSPNNLLKECLVVIDRNIIKPTNNSDIFNSDLDDTPLSNIKLKENVKGTTSDSDEFVDKVTKNKSDKIINSELENLPIHEIIEDSNNKSQNILNTEQDSLLSNTTSKENTLEDEVFVEKLIKKKSHKKTSTTDLRKRKTQDVPTQNLLEDEDDDVFVTKPKKTILIRKSYVKPTQAKSTGSITLRDLEDIKSRIEHKKELLLAKTFTEDTIELQELIRKWRKGCQEALSELIDLMKKKFPEKHNMDYSELLEILKIPTSVVGYDPEHDCFKNANDFDIFGF